MNWEKRYVHGKTAADDSEAFRLNSTNYETSSL